MPLTDDDIGNLLTVIEWSLENQPLKPTNYDKLIEIANKLELMRPKPDHEPPWRTLDEATQNDLAMMMIEEVRDGAREFAHDTLDTMSIEECAEYGLSSDGVDGEGQGEDYTPAQIAAWLKEHVVEKSS